MKIEGGHEQKIMLKMLFFWFCFVFLIVSLYNWHFLIENPAKFRFVKNLCIFSRLRLLLRKKLSRPFYGALL